MVSDAEANQQVLAQTELDLANAIVLIQEKEAELTALKPPTPPITLALTDADADNLAVPLAVTSQAGFGTSFPTNPNKGDMYLRVDMLPNKPYKWNGKKWIEVDKSTTDRYAYEESYIQYLIDKIKTREYTLDDLTKAEQEEVLIRLDYDTKRKL